MQVGYEEAPIQREQQGTAQNWYAGEAEYAPHTFLKAEDAPTLEECRRATRLIRKMDGDPKKELRGRMLYPDAHALPYLSAVWKALGPAPEIHGRALLVASWTLGRIPLDPETENLVVTKLCESLDNATVVRKAFRGERLTRSGCRLFKLLFVPMATLILLGGVIFVLMAACYYIHGGATVNNSTFGGMMLMLGLFLASLGGAFMVALFGGIFGAPFFLPFSLAWDKLHTFRIQCQTARALGRCPRPEAVGALAAAMCEPHAELRRRAEKSLWRALPTLTPEHYGQMPERTSANLCRALRRKTSQPFVPGSHEITMALLDALGKVGEGGAAKAVAEVADFIAEPRVRSEAARVLPILQERERQQTARAVLLRGASAPPVPIPELLRPVVDTVSFANGKELLHPVTEKSSDGHQCPL